MAEVRILQDGGKDIIPVTHESAVLDDNGVKISDKYATKEDLNNIDLTNYVTKSELDEVTALLNELVSLLNAQVTNGISVANSITRKL